MTDSTLAVKAISVDLHPAFQGMRDESGRSQGDLLNITCAGDGAGPPAAKDMPFCSEKTDEAGGDVNRGASGKSDAWSTARHDPGILSASSDWPPPVAAAPVRGSSTACPSGSVRGVRPDVFSSHSRYLGGEPVTRSTRVRDDQISPPESQMILLPSGRMLHTSTTLTLMPCAASRSAARSVSWPISEVATTVPVTYLALAEQNRHGLLLHLTLDLVQPSVHEDQHALGVRRRRNAQ